MLLWHDSKGSSLQRVGLLLFELKKSRNEISVLRLAQEARKNLCEHLTIETEANDMESLNRLMDDYNFIQSCA